MYTMHRRKGIHCLSGLFAPRLTSRKQIWNTTGGQGERETERDGEEEREGEGERW